MMDARWRTGAVRLALVLMVAAILVVPVRIPYRVLILAAVAVAATQAEAGNLKPIGLFRHPLRPTLIWGATLALVAAGLVGEVVEPGIERLIGTPADYAGYGALAGNAPAALRMLGYALVSAAIGEEIVARGFLLHQIEALLGRRRGTQAVSVVLAASAFALAHARQGLVGVIATGLIGLVFGWAFFRSGRNLPALILAHGLTDTYGVAMLYLGRYG